MPGVNALHLHVVHHIPWPGAHSLRHPVRGRAAVPATLDQPLHAPCIGDPDVQGRRDPPPVPQNIRTTARLNRGIPAHTLGGAPVPAGAQGGPVQAAGLSWSTGSSRPVKMFGPWDGRDFPSNPETNAGRPTGPVGSLPQPQARKSGMSKPTYCSAR